MPTHESLLAVLTKFSRTLASPFDLTDVLYELSDSVVLVLRATGAGVSLQDDHGQLQFASSTSEAVANIEVVQTTSNAGPCHRAFATGQAVTVDDLELIEDEGWSEYRAVAINEGFRAVAGIPLRSNERRLGALNIYDSQPRTWSDDDIAVATVLADIATGYILHASDLDESRRLNEQLQKALDNRVLIEQAKGILAGEQGISLDRARDVLTTQARNNNATLRSVADAVVNLGLRPRAVK